MCVHMLSNETFLQDKKVVPCRFDWHQTGSQVIISIYAKNAVPELSYVEANSTTVSVTEACHMISDQIFNYLLFDYVF